MQEFEDFLATISFPPNPYRNIDNSLPSDLALAGHFFTGVGGDEGEPMSTGNAASAVSIFTDHHLVPSLSISCSECHTLPTGLGTNLVLSVDELGQPSFEPFPVGPDGELHHAVVFSPQAETTNISIKIPHLRNLHEKIGFDMTHTTSRAGFGFMHDGSVDTLSRFMGEPVFIFDQGLDLPPQLLVPAMVAFMLTFSGSDLPMGEGVPTGPIGPLSKDTHAAVGTQITLNDLNNNEPETLALIDDMIALADAEQDSTPGPEVAVVAKGVQDGIQRGYAYIGNDLLQSDRVRETLTVDALRQASATGAEVTFTVVSRGSELRIGVDRDEDGHFDRDELDACSDPANPSSVPDPTDLNGNAIPDACECLGDVDDDGEVNVLDLLQLLSQWGECEGCSGDSDGDGQIGVIDLLALLAQWGPC